MRVEISTVLNCPAAEAWRAVSEVRLLLHVSAPLLTFKPIDPPELPEVWEGGRFLVSMRLLGVLPMGRQWIVPRVEMEDSTPGGMEFRMRDNGTGRLAKRWDHLITMRELPGDRTFYQDRVEVGAGVLTPLVWAFAQAFYRHRQRRWRALVRRGFSF